MAEAAPSGPVTVVVSRLVKPGLEADYEAWIADSVEVMKRFPGFLGGAVQKPTALNPHWVFMPRWASTEHLMGWDNSPELAARVALLEPLIEGGTQRQRIEGLDFWFTPPTGAVTKPSPWKMMLVTLLVLWPTIIVLGLVLGPIEKMVPFPFSPLVILVPMVPLLEFVLMPLVTRALRGWLFGARA